MRLAIRISVTIDWAYGSSKNTPHTPLHPHPSLPLVQEWAADISDDKKVAQFERFNRLPSPEDVALNTRSVGGGPDGRPPIADYKPYKETPVFKGGRVLRDYQLEGLNWMVWNWYHRRNCILADEMGLGKTVQSVSFLEHLRRHQGVRGPFLIAAPLSTLGHWKRECEDWTDMNTVYYHDPQGGADARQLIRNHEFCYPGQVVRYAADFGRSTSAQLHLTTIFHNPRLTPRFRLAHRASLSLLFRRASAWRLQTSTSSTSSSPPTTCCCPTGTTCPPSGE